MDNIKLEIELTNKERGDSIIDDDIEKALDIKVEKNKTLTLEEVEKINMCCEEENWMKVILPSIYIIICAALGIVVVLLVGYGLLHLIKNYVLN
tara:strand:+ start:5954 stop:6235 length:282 start_codon:yes stop_codon:yes gene_type:complete